MILIDEKPWTQSGPGASQWSHLAKIAAVAARDNALVGITNWTSVKFEDERVLIAGPVMDLEHNEICKSIIEHPDVLLAFPLPPCNHYPWTTTELVAIESLKRIGGFDPQTRYQNVDQVLQLAALRGVITNAYGWDRAWSGKHQLELKLAAWSRHTGRTLQRPRTRIATGAELKNIVAEFTMRGDICIVKPAHSSGGEGIQIFSAGLEANLLPSDHYVVQELLAHPLLLSSRKADVRFYVLLDPDMPESSSLVDPIFVRTCYDPYERGRLESEITNTFQQVKRGNIPLIAPLEKANLPLHLKTVIREHASALTSELLEAWQWWHSVADIPVIPNRVFLWGADLFISDSSSPDGLLLEVNTYPRLFRGVSECDNLVENELLASWMQRLKAKFSLRM
ncbi:tubulin--tyrosine ligase family protein [Methylorubrum extorquens]|uniref:tubulin--tyrosine ligase family protein n=1 Tax=Methylorubrum extorquens TaxID=408 RepID=UPI0022380CF8|nr:tubulin--tyrosine ligase family protein [Methylorubrum extorquens]UYW32649.1 tubulin--tyrosine ligase family protein [Methylorubrum extorquens]